MTMPQPEEPVDFMKMMEQMAHQLQAAMGPVLREHLVECQENPTTRFATVIGDEVMIDFDKLVENILHVPPPVQM